MHNSRMSGEVDPTRAEMQAQIDDLENRGSADRGLISDLEHQISLDHALIKRLEATEEIERVEVESLRTALATCRRVGVAVGVLMTAKHVSQAVAFDVLSVASQKTGRTLRDVADYVTLTGDIPTSTQPTGEAPGAIS